MTLTDRFGAVMMPNYGQPPLALVAGQGSQVWDDDGRQYLDLVAGIAVSSLGHAHPAITEAVSRQINQIAHTSNLYAHPRAVELAERLTGLLGTDEARVFFANSGTEANEAALKLVRKIQGQDRTVIVAAEGGFHGRTMGSLAITGKASIREPFAPFGFTTRFVPFADLHALREATTAGTAAVFTEPCLGEGGVIPAPDGYLRAARQIADEAGALLVVDEIQSGIGRTGSWFACQREAVRPDILTLAKGLGGGLPIGACIGFGGCGAAFGKGDHGSTFGGNPVACAAALAVIDTISRDKLLDNVTAVGERLADGIVKTDHPLLADVRGTGLWLGVVLHKPVAAQVEAAARQRGFLVNAVQPDVIRLAPPLILTADEADEFSAALPEILTEAER
jgi:acetylornithine/N-succinyldiaminopimelate aminotransferase